MNMFKVGILVRRIGMKNTVAGVYALSIVYVSILVSSSFELNTGIVALATIVLIVGILRSLNGEKPRKYSLAHVIVVLAGLAISMAAGMVFLVDVAELLFQQDRLGRFDSIGFQLAAAALAFISIATISYGGSIGARAIAVTEMTVRSRSLNTGDPAVSGPKIGVISDLHIGCFTPISVLERAVQKLNKANVDIVVVLGDLVDDNLDSIDEISRLLSALRAEELVWVVLGNHDVMVGADEIVGAIESHNNVFVLRNDSQTWEFSRTSLQITLIGIESSATWWVNDQRANESGLRKLLGETTEANGSHLRILLSHQPEAFRMAAEYGIDLTLAGHTHGGQIAVPWLRRINLAAIVSNFPRGIYRLSDSVLYVTTGLGLGVLPARLGAPPEVGVITIVPDNEN